MDFIIQAKAPGPNGGKGKWKPTSLSFDTFDAAKAKVLALEAAGGCNPLRVVDRAGYLVMAERPY